MIDVSKFNSLIELLEAFPDEESCIVYLEKLRWRNGKVKSPFDKKSKVYYLPNHRYMCKNTQKIFNVKVGTIFHGTKLPLRKWFMAIWLVLAHKKGISSLQLSRDLKITQKTAWYILQKIRTMNFMYTIKIGFQMIEIIIYQQIFLVICLILLNGKMNILG